MKTKLYFLIVCTLCSTFLLSAQIDESDFENRVPRSEKRFALRTFEGLRSDFGLSYNFFLGDDAQDFRTSINGFGSGFLLDLYSARISWNLVTVGNYHANLSLGAGFGFSSYRFAENLIIQNEDGTVTWETDQNPDNDYGNGFFSFGKSKMVSTTFAVPVNMNFNVGKFFLSTGATYDIFMNGKLKRKFRNNGDKTRVVTKNETFNDFPVNRHKLGFSAAIMHKPSGLNIGATYMTTPFFQEGNGPDINEVRVSVSYCLPLSKRNQWDREFWHDEWD